MRHAEAFKNLDPPPEGLTEAELDRLTPAGEVAARAAGATLPGGVVAVWASPRGRTRQTAALLGAGDVLVDEALRPLDGDMAWSEREAAWSRGEDPRPPGGESLADAQVRAADVIARLRAQLGPGQAAALVTHGDFGPVLLGELRGTLLLERPEADGLNTAEVRCLPLP